MTLNCDLDKQKPKMKIKFEIMKDGNLFERVRLNISKNINNRNKLPFNKYTVTCIS